MNSPVDMDEGYTNDFLIHGLFTLIASGIAFLWHWSFTIVLVALSIALFRIRSGIEVDIDGKRARVYKAIAKLKWGSWVDASRFDRIELKYTNESQVMSNRGVETNVRVRTYDLHFEGPKGASCLFHEFSDYAKARRCVDVILSNWSMTLTDEIQERRQRSQATAHQRKR